MKKIFTLIATALVALGANAQTTNISADAAYVVDGLVAGNSTLMSDDNVTITTVYDGAKVATNSQTIGGIELNDYIQVRIEDAPSAETPTGTQRTDCTPLVVAVSKDITFTFYYRRQQASDGTYTNNDGKDIKIVDQADPTTLLEGTMELGEPDGDYSYGTKTLNLAAGHTYTIFSKGATGRIYAFAATASDPASINGVEAVVDEDAPEYNLGGGKVGKAFKGVVLKGGKKFVK